MQRGSAKKASRRERAAAANASASAAIAAVTAREPDPAPAPVPEKKGAFSDSFHTQGAVSHPGYA
eukprot:1442975-Prymnesium_polylepis.1